MEDDFDDLTYYTETVSVLIAGGFFNEDDLETYIAEMAFDPNGAPYANAVRDHALAAMETKRKAEAGWPAVTDWDRLARAFDALEASDILALHNAGMTTSDAHGDAWDLISRDPANSWRGFAFYHGQDVERAVAGGSLFIGFDAVAKGAEAKRAIGEVIVAALKTEGFAPMWSGDPEVRIEVGDITWQKRTDWVRRSGPSAAAAGNGFWRKLFG